MPKPRLRACARRVSRDGFAVHDPLPIVAAGRSHSRAAARVGFWAPDRGRRRGRGPADATKLLPAKVRVAADHTYLRAGPSDDFYPTERLVKDAEVEIWAFDASGYAAVRPVIGGFSWVRAADVDDEALLDDGPAARCLPRKAASA